MSEADKMFEGLGYKKTYNQLGIIEYYKDDDNIICFYLANKSFNKIGKFDGMHDDITMQELKVINKKVEELGWSE